MISLSRALANLFGVLRSIDRLRVFRAIAPIRFPRWTDDDWLFVAAEGVDEVRSRIMPVNRKYPLRSYSKLAVTTSRKNEG